MYYLSDLKKMQLWLQKLLTFNGHKPKVVQNLKMAGVESVIKTLLMYNQKPKTSSFYKTFISFWCVSNMYIMGF